VGKLLKDGSDNISPGLACASPDYSKIGDKVSVVIIGKQFPDAKKDVIPLPDQYEIKRKLYDKCAYFHERTGLEDKNIHLT
jgi:hypothetical protein